METKHTESDMHASIESHRGDSENNVSERKRQDATVKPDTNETFTEEKTSDINLSALIEEAYERDMSLPDSSSNAYVTVDRLFNAPLSRRLEETEVRKGAPVYIRIFKKEAVLELWVEKEGRYIPLKFYRICAYSGHLGPKLKEGDKQAPEGFYRVYPRQLNPHSRFHLAFNLGYPNAYDRAHGRTGSYLMVHGDCVSVGCYAMTDEKIEEIYAMVASALKHGQRYVPVHIFPFRMEEETMEAYSDNRWYDFWTELKEGYDYFEAEEIPPRVETINGHYTILDP